MPVIQISGQNTLSIGIGPGAASGNQGINSIAIGNQAGYSGQGPSSIAIGPSAGYDTQGQNSIAIGYNAGSYRLPAYTIVLNTGPTALNPSTSGLFINSIGATAGSGSTAAPLNGGYTLVYNSTTSEIKYNTSKTFVIDHPIDEEKYLVHACLEGPEAGVYYRGDGEITDNISTTIYLPDYVERLATDLTVQLTPIYNDDIKIYNISASRVKRNKFNVYGNNCEFYWTVYGKRLNINVEPLKNNSNINGEGPYKWLSNN